MIWTNGSIPFPFGKGISGVLANCLLCGAKATFRKVQFVQVFMLKPAPFCKFFAGLGSTNKSSISLLSESCFVLAVCPLLRLSFYLKLWKKLSFFSSCTIKLQWVPGHSFLRGNYAVDELGRWGALLVPSAMPCLHLFTSRILSFLRLERYHLI